MAEREKRQIAIVCAIITNEQGEVFLQRRHDPGNWVDGFWEFPGGKIEFGEDPLDAVIREAKEESGYEIKPIRLLSRIYQHVNENIDGIDWNVILICYEAKVVGGEYNPSDEESKEGRFFSRSEIDYSKCLEYTKEIIELLDK